MRIAIVLLAATYTFFFTGDATAEQKVIPSTISEQAQDYIRDNEAAPLNPTTLEEWQKLGDMKLWLGTSSDESKLDSKSRTLSIELHDAEMAREIFYEEEAE